MSTTRDRFWDFVCLFSTQAYVLLAVSVALLFLMGFAWLHASGDSRWLIRVNVAVLTVNVVVLATIIRLCKAREL